MKDKRLRKTNVKLNSNIVRAVQNFKLSNLHALKCEHNKYTISYVTRHFLIATVSFKLLHNARHTH
jgi:hypothetical protein